MLRRRRIEDLRSAGGKAVAVLALVLPLLSRDVRKTNRDDADRITKLAAIFANFNDSKSPGIAVLVRKDGQSVFEHGYGVRDLRTFTPIDPQTNFRLASCTKQITALAIMLLVHDGKLRYNQNLTEVFPEFPAYGKTITIRDLLNHTSGLQDYETLMEQEERNGGRHWTEENQIQDFEVLGLLEKQSSTLFRPNTKWAYSNSGYVLLGSIVARVSGEPFGDFLHERIFAPLKMNQTLAYEKSKNEIADRAFGHTKQPNGWKQSDQSATSATLGDGGVYSSLRDLAKWDDALAQNTLLSETEMMPALVPVKLAGGARPVWPPDQDRPPGTPARYGFGWFLNDYRGHPRMWHYGDTMGFHSYIARIPGDKLSIILLCNRTDLNLEQLAERVEDIYLKPTD